MSPKEKLIERIEQLLALSENNPSPEEAASAAAMAQRLMLENEIERAELHAAPEPEAILDHCEDSSTVRLEAWKATIWFAVCDANRCHGVTQRGRNSDHCRDARPARFNVYGRTSNVQTVVYMFKYLCAEVERLSKLATAERPEGSHAFAFGNSWRRGAARTIANRLAAEARVDRVHMEHYHSDALVVVDADKSAVDDAFADAYPDLGSYRPGGVSERDAYADGVAAAREINLGGSAGKLGTPAKQLGGGNGR